MWSRIHKYTQGVLNTADFILQRHLLLFCCTLGKYLVTGCTTSSPIGIWSLGIAAIWIISHKKCLTTSVHFHAVIPMRPQNFCGCPCHLIVKKESQMAWAVHGTDWEQSIIKNYLTLIYQYTCIALLSLPLRTRGGWRFLQRTEGVKKENFEKPVFMWKPSMSFFRASILVEDPK